MAPVSAVIIMGKISDRKKALQPPEGNNFCCTGYGGILSLQNEDVLSGRASVGLSARKYHGMDFAGKYINYKYRA